MSGKHILWGVPLVTSCTKFRISDCFLKMMRYTEQKEVGASQLSSSPRTSKSTSQKQFDCISGTSTRERQSSLSSVGDAPEYLERSRSAPKPKASYLKFLVWVAYLRNRFPLMDEVQTRTCPLLGCQELLETQDAMLVHVYTCSRLAKGRYRCPGCQREEPVNRTHIKGCPDSNACKEWLANSFKSVKIRLSRQGSSKSCSNFSESPVSPLSPNQITDKSTKSNGQFPSDVTYNTDNGTWARAQELDSSPISELLETSARVELDSYQLQPTYVNGNVQNQQYTTSSINPEKNALHTSVLHTQLNVWTDTDSSPSCFTSSVPSYLSHQEQTTGILGHNFPSDSYLHHYRPEPLPELEGNNYSTVYHHANESNSLVSPLSYSSSQQYSSIISPLSPINNRVSTSMPSMAELPANYISTNYSSRNDFPARMSISSTYSNASMRSTGISDYVKTPIIYEEAESPRGLVQEALNQSSPSHAGYTRAHRIGPVNVASWSSRSEAYSQARGYPSMQQLTPHHHTSTYNLDNDLTRNSALAPSSQTQTTNAELQCACGHIPRGQKRNKLQNLNRHKRTCSVSSPDNYTAKPYKCPHPNCDRACTRSDNLLVHLRSHGSDDELGLDSEAVNNIMSSPTLKRHRRS